MGEEIGDHSIWGQTSWISCGLKIQEMQYASVPYAWNGDINSIHRLGIRYQLRSYGSHLTIEDEQILENKRIHLQKLIDMFEHQMDAFLFHHELTDDVSISPLDDYSKYDHVDDIDDSGNPAQSDTIHTSRNREPYHSDISGRNAEDIAILLPSSLGWDWCMKHGHRSLAIKEAKLRYAQATDAIHRIRLALGFKSALFRTQVRHARTQKTKTRAWTAVHGIDAIVHDHARNYSMARDAYAKVQDPSSRSQELPALQLTDLRVHTLILGAGKHGQHNEQLPWIWSFGTSNRKDETWMDDCELPFMWISYRNADGVQSAEFIGSGRRHSLSGGRKSRTAFTMRLYGSLPISMQRLSAGQLGGNRQYRSGCLSMQHMPHIRFMHGKNFPKVQRRHLLQLHLHHWSMCRLHCMYITVCHTSMVLNSRVQVSGYIYSGVQVSGYIYSSRCIAGLDLAFQQINISLRGDQRCAPILQHCNSGRLLPRLQPWNVMTWVVGPNCHDQSCNSSEMNPELQLHWD